MAVDVHQSGAGLPAGESMGEFIFLPPAEFGTPFSNRHQETAFRPLADADEVRRRITAVNVEDSLS